MWYLALYYVHDNYDLIILDQDPQLQQHVKAYQFKYQNMISYIKIRSKTSLDIILDDFKQGQKEGLNLHDLWYQLNNKYSSHLSVY